MPDGVLAQITDHTDGVPLFVEELTKSVLEGGLLREADRSVLESALPPVAIPTTLHASLLARPDRLASARRVAEIGAAIGRQFSYALVRAVARLPEHELQAALTGWSLLGWCFSAARRPSGSSSADSGGSRPRIRDDVAQHSDLISLGVPR